MTNLRQMSLHSAKEANTTQLSAVSGTKAAFQCEQARRAGGLAGAP